MFVNFDACLENGMEPVHLFADVLPTNALTPFLFLNGGARFCNNLGDRILVHSRKTRWRLSFCFAHFCIILVHLWGTS